MASMPPPDATVLLGVLPMGLNACRVDTHFAAGESNNG